MQLLAPASLALLVVVPLAAALYVVLLRRHRRYAVRYPSLLLLREAALKLSGWRRHGPFGLLLLAMGGLAAASARPATVALVPAGSTTILLAMDISHSMCATDIAPSRMEAAKRAARLFVQNQGGGTQVGLVAFAGFAELVQAPTDDEELVLDAINGLVPAPRTAIGDAILESLTALAEVDARVLPVGDEEAGLGVQPLPEAQYLPHVIVLLTDGANNVGALPADAARQAAARGVRVYTIGFGTQRGSTGRMCNREYGDTFEFGQRLYQEIPGTGSLRGIDELALREVADLTGGAYYPATSGGELQEVLVGLPITVLLKKEYTEISAAFVAGALLLAVLAMSLGWIWNSSAA